MSIVRQMPNRVKRKASTLERNIDKSQGGLGDSVPHHERGLFFLGALRWAASVSLYSAGRFICLMNSTRRNRTADQSSSIATMETGSNPSFPSGAQPWPYLISDL